jgi:integrase
MEKPKIAGAPGLVWRPRKSGWVATWQARSDLIKLGFMPQTVQLWNGTIPSEVETKHIKAQCERLQSEMLMFSRAGDYQVPDGVRTLRELVNKYQIDPASRHGKKRYATRINHENILKRIVASHGDEQIADIRYKTLVLWHDEWSGGGTKLAGAHTFMALLRAAFAFGMSVLEDRECERLCAVMRQLRLPTGGDAREEVITVEQVIAHRAKCREIGYFSMALAQAIQFELMFRQKDVIGEWIPLDEKEVSDVIHRKKQLKWVRGLRWEHINEDFILTKVTSKKGKKVSFDLRLAPMVMEELNILIDFLGGKPTKGPIIVLESTAQPWSAVQFRQTWRKIARIVGIPDNVQDRDYRAAGISEATEAGAELEHVKHAATHSNINMTERYSRMKDKKIRNVQLIRLQTRNGTKTE